MQLLNSKILPDSKNTRYSNKKHKIRNILCFLSVVAFSYYKDGGAVEALPFPAGGSPTARIC